MQLKPDNVLKNALCRTALKTRVFPACGGKRVRLIEVFAHVRGHIHSCHSLIMKHIWETILSLSLCLLIHLMHLIAFQSHKSEFHISSSNNCCDHYIIWWCSLPWCSCPTAQLVLIPCVFVFQVSAPSCQRMVQNIWSSSPISTLIKLTLQENHENAITHRRRT